MKTFTLALVSVLLFQPPMLAETLTGNLRLIDNRIRETDGQCHGTGRFSDLIDQLRVTVKDGSGKILAVGLTAKGRRPTPEEVKNPDDIRYFCLWEFELKDLPKADFYTVAIGRRGSMDYSYAELVKLGWKVEFFLAR